MPDVSKVVLILHFPAEHFLSAQVSVQLLFHYIRDIRQHVLLFIIFTGALTGFLTQPFDIMAGTRLND